MRLSHLSLLDFRNYARLELDIPPGPVLFIGENAQGKTNLLEAAYLLSTTRSLRAGSEVELIRRAEDGMTPPAARIAGVAVRGAGKVQVEVLVARRDVAAGEGRTTHASKRLRVNGIPHRATGVVGQILAVLFTSMDIDLITGPPANRRRYLDITLSQVEPAYLRALQRYTRVLQQRNSLFRQINEGHAGVDELGPWDDEMITHGATIIATRATAVAQLSVGAGEFHRNLTDDRESLALAYLPQLGGDQPSVDALVEEGKLRERLRTAILRRRPREIAAGVSLIGPHRDDVRVTLDGEPVAAYGSRAQQRTVALAIRLAEASLLRERSGESPILLLDDILSELDERRRHAVLRTIAHVEQALITTADLDRFPGSFLQGASLFAVAEGQVQPLNAGG